MDDELRFELFPESELQCSLCGECTATISITRNNDHPLAKWVCCECVSCLVTAGLQGPVCRDMADDCLALEPRQ